jgi:hypothetical protein
MIDKLDVRIPRKTQFTPEFHKAYRHAAENGVLKPSEYYTQTGDFRPYGYPIRLHMFASRGKQRKGNSSRDHKLELYDTAEMTLEEMVAEIRRVFVCDPWELQMMRRDVCVDVVGVSVQWFKAHTRVEFKRNVREIGFMTVDAKRGETYYLGAKPNQFRFYNKVAERLYRYRWMVREGKKQGLAIGAFEKVFGHSEDAIITRIERQYGGSQCSGTLHSLLKMDRGNPFSPLKFLRVSEREISSAGLDSTTYWAALHLQRMVQEIGAQRVRAHMTDLVGSKNVKKTWDKYAPYLLPGDDGPGIDEELLFQLYLNSVMVQLGFAGSLAAPNRGAE